SQLRRQGFLKRGALKQPEWCLAVEDPCRTRIEEFISRLSLEVLPEEAGHFAHIHLPRNHNGSARGESEEIVESRRRKHAQPAEQIDAGRKILERSARK